MTPEWEGGGGCEGGGGANGVTVADGAGAVLTMAAATIRISDSSSVGRGGGRGWAVDDDGFHDVRLLVVHLIAGGRGGVMTILVGCLLLREPIKFSFFLRGVFSAA